jgi:hypothetical protein
MVLFPITVDGECGRNQFKTCTELVVGVASLLGEVFKIVYAQSRREEKDCPMPIN